MMEAMKITSEKFFSNQNPEYISYFEENQNDKAGTGSYIFVALYVVDELPLKFKLRIEISI